MNNDLISRSALLEQVRFSLPIDSERRRVIADCVEITRRLVTEAPAADAVEVVRCKNCIHSNDAGCATGFTWCDKYDCGVTDDFYCKTGERRPDNAD